MTFVDTDDRSEHRISVSIRHEVELVDGNRVLLLDDRGWNESGGWDTTSIENVEETARVVVGPDEPPTSRSREAEQVLHWTALEQIAQRQGVAVDAAELERLTHDVVLSQAVLARIGTDSGTNTVG